MRIAVVDDEYYARKALSMIIRRCAEQAEIPCEVEEYSNGVEFIRCAAEPPNLLFTDINMAEMDGLALCEYMNGYCPQTVVAIVSGYLEFEFARKALRMGVVEYLTKPVDDEDVLKILENAQSTRPAHSLRQSRDTELAQWLFTPHYEDESAELGRLLGSEDSFSGYYVVAIADRNLSQVDVSPVLERAANDRALARGVRNHAAKVTVVVHAHKEQPSFQEERATMEGWHQTLEGDCAMGGSSWKETPGELHAAYNEAVLAIMHAMLPSQGNVWGYWELPTHFNVSFQGLSAKVQESLGAGKAEAACDIISQTFDRAASVRRVNIRCIQQGLIEIGLLVNTFAQEFHLICEPIAIWRILSFVRYRDAVDYILHAVKEMTGSDVYLQKHVPSDISTQLKWYVRHHYREDINLTELAKKVFFMHPNSVSRRFKEDTGMSFSQYLTLIRMEKAQELLDHGELRITDVASSVGYNSAAHFIQVFKRHFGKTPGEHAKILYKVVER